MLIRQKLKVNFYFDKYMNWYNITAVKNACFNSKTNIYLKKYNIVCRIIQIILHEIIEEKENTGNFSGRIFFLINF